MKLDYTSQFALMEQVADALIEKLGVAKTMEFFASIGLGEGDYTRLRKKLFDRESVESLYAKIKSKPSPLG